VHNNRIVIIGAGIAGLSAALELSAQGFDVAVFEGGDEPGGKMRQAVVAGSRIDAGPTVFTMRWVFDELFASGGSALEDHLTLQPLSVLARHAWHNSPPLDLFADIEQSVDAIGQFSGAQSARGYRDFCRDAARVYRSLESTFIRAQRPTVPGLITGFGLSGVADLLKWHPFVVLWNELGKYFKDPRLQQLFGRYSTYCGSSPYLAPATLMLVAHVEQEGVWQIRGGMQNLAIAVEKLAKTHGAQFRYNTKVSEILVSGGRASGVVLDTGERIAASAVISAADVAALPAGLFGKAVQPAVKAMSRTERSLSAITYALVAETDGFPLSHHTVFFSTDYKREFDDITTRARAPSEPTVYVCAQDRGEHHAHPPGTPERLFLITNAPARGDTTPPEAWEISQCEQRTFGHLERLGLKVRRSPDRILARTPTDFERLYPATGGALYGPASHGWAASFRREGSTSKIPGLYLASGSAHPGPGVPMSALSGRLAAAQVVKDFTSRVRSRPAVMLGGMSMP
jgi:1-hydroxycarotenoid 3,4-desaturase